MVRGRFEVARIQARRASECIFSGIVMHSLARRACIENAFWCEFPGKTQRECESVTLQGASVGPLAT